MCACIRFTGCWFFNLWLEHVHAWPNRGATLINYKLTHIHYKIHKKSLDPLGSAQNLDHNSGTSIEMKYTTVVEEAFRSSTLVKAALPHY